MIRIGQEEFFIEPLNQQRTGGEEEEEKEGGRKHIVYRSSAIMKKPPAVNQSADDVLRGDTTQTETLISQFMSQTKRRKFLAPSTYLLLEEGTHTHTHSWDVEVLVQLLNRSSS